MNSEEAVYTRLSHSPAVEPVDEEQDLITSMKACDHVPKPPTAKWIWYSGAA